MKHHNASLASCTSSARAAPCSAVLRSYSHSAASAASSARPKPAERRGLLLREFVIERDNAALNCLGPGVKSCRDHNRRFGKSSLVRRKSCVVSSFLSLGILSLAGTSRFAAADDTLKVAIPQKGAWDAGIAELGQRGGIFKKHGLDLDILYTAAGPESIQAVIGGSIDIATASGVSAAIGTFAKGAPIRIFSGEMTGAPDLYWFVPANSPIHTVQDMNGKTVAFSAVGSSSHGSLLALIAQYHLTAKPTADRQHRGDDYPDHDRPGRCRVRRRPVRA